MRLERVCEDEKEVDLSAVYGFMRERGMILACNDSAYCRSDRYYPSGIVTTNANAIEDGLERHKIISAGRHFSAWGMCRY